MEEIIKIHSQYRMMWDLHTHTQYSCCGPYKHGKGTVMQNVTFAANKGIQRLAITDHGPGHRIYGIGLNRLSELRKEIDEAAAAYPEMEILLGVEANICDTPNGLDVRPEEMSLFDVVLGGYHYGVLHGNMMKNSIYSHVGLPSGSRAALTAKNTEMALRAIYENKLLVLTHPGDKGPFEIVPLIEACEKTGTYMEISSRHKQMTVEQLRIARDYDVKFVVSSDAHKPNQVGTYEAGMARALEAGIELERIVNITERYQGE